LVSTQASWWTGWLPIEREELKEGVGEMERKERDLQDLDAGWKRREKVAVALSQPSCSL
jgi:hypothetical protein